MILTIALETTDWSIPTPYNITWILSLFYAMFPSQPIILSSLYIYVSDPGFHLPSGFMRCISYIPSSTAINGLDVKKYGNVECINNVMWRSKLGKYMLWSSTYGSMSWYFSVSLTTRPDYLTMNGVIRLLYMLGTYMALLNTSTYTFAVYLHVCWTAMSTIDTFYKFR